MILVLVITKNVYFYPFIKKYTLIFRVLLEQYIYIDLRYGFTTKIDN